MDLDRFVGELSLSRQREALSSLRHWFNEDESVCRHRFAGYGRLLALTTSAQETVGIVDLVLDGTSDGPTVRPAQLLRGGEVLMAEGLALGEGRSCRYSVPLWIHACYPEIVSWLELGWHDQA